MMIKRYRRFVFTSLCLSYVLTGCAGTIKSVDMSNDPETSSDSLHTSESEKVSESCYFKQTESKPLWTDKEPADKDFLYGLGIADRQNSYPMQKRLSEVLAKKEIALKIGSHIYSEFEDKNISIRKDDKEYSEQIVKSTIKEIASAYIRGIGIVDRWEDEEFCRIYSLVRIPASQIPQLYAQFLTRIDK